MWVLNNKNKSIQAKISNFIDVKLSYSVVVENHDINNKSTLQPYEGTLDDTYQDIIPSPSNNITKEIKSVNIRNIDTNIQTIEIILNDSHTNENIILFSCILDVNENLIYDSQTGWAIYTEQGLKKNDNNVDYLIILDTTNDPINYVGYATPGTSTSDSSWKIKRVDTTGGATVEWANGEILFNNIWDDRASLPYS